MIDYIKAYNKAVGSTKCKPEERKEAKNLIKGIVLKETLKKPIYQTLEGTSNNILKRTCPSCGDTVGIDVKGINLERYCRYCGQALLTEEEMKQ